MYRSPCWLSVFSFLVACGAETGPTARPVAVESEALCCETCCLIDDECMLEGHASNDNPCLVCDPDGTGGPLGWSEATGACDDEDPCTEGDACAAGLCEGTPLAQGSPCDDGDLCTVDELCDASGACVGVPRDCSAGEGCAGFLCLAGVCLDPAGLGCAADGVCVPAGTAHPAHACLLCDPDGAEPWAALSVGTGCGAGQSCSESSGAPVLIAADRCDATGDCVPGETSDCGTYGHCANETECASYCDSAEACTTDASCEEHACVGHRSTGVACSTSLQCLSGACVDRVCCASCDVPCNGCAAALTGAPDGFCAPLVAGIDEHDDCEVEAQSGCGQDGTCDGAGACRLYGVQTPCGPTSCSPFNELVGEHCDGLGACLGGTPVSCSPGVCRSGVCELACGSDRECAPGAWCDLQSGQCSAANRAPTAVLTGGTQAISNVPLVLSGEDSFDPDGDSLTYDFVQVVGPQAELQTTPMPEIMSATMPTVDASTTLVFELTVSDGQAQSEPASLFVELAPPDVPGWVTCLDCNAAAGGLGSIGGTLCVLCRRRRRQKQAAPTTNKLPAAGIRA